jgi:hypothetical protein
MQFFGDDLCCNNGEEALVITITNDFDKICKIGI